MEDCRGKSMSDLQIIEELDSKLRSGEITLREYLERIPYGYIAQQKVLEDELIQHVGYTPEQMGYDK